LKSTFLIEGAFVFLQLKVSLMPSKCYILYSKKLNSFYIGATSEEVDIRLYKHNNKSYGKHRYTAKTEDWEIFLILEAKNYSHAIRLERKIKSMKSKTFIRNLKKYPELRQKTINQTST
jgi:putative endonuclease